MVAGEIDHRHAGHLDVEATGVGDGPDGPGQLGPALRPRCRPSFPAVGVTVSVTNSTAAQAFVCVHWD